MTIWASVTLKKKKQTNIFNIFQYNLDETIQVDIYSINVHKNTNLVE